MKKVCRGNVDDAVGEGEVRKLRVIPPEGDEKLQFCQLLTQVMGTEEKIRDDLLVKARLVLQLAQSLITRDVSPKISLIESSAGSNDD
jgi:hypothetical protein